MCSNISTSSISNKNYYLYLLYENIKMVKIITYNIEICSTNLF